MSKERDSTSSASPQFDSTRWSLVLEAGHRSSPGSRRALEELCRLYWYPLYAYVRRRGYDLHEAQDLTQEFFSRLVETHAVEVADPNRGRFRSFLLASLRNFLANHWDKNTARKRGGGHSTISLDFATGEFRYAAEPTDEDTPERLYQKQWAIALLDHVMSLLRAEFVCAGKEQQFEQLKVFIAGRNAAVSYAEAAQALGITEAAAMTAGSRLRRRYRALLRAEIAQTVANPGEIEEEYRDLFEILGS